MFVIVRSVSDEAIQDNRSDPWIASLLSLATGLAMT
jgi:hypothetical protein